MNIMLDGRLLEVREVWECACSIDAHDHQEVFGFLPRCAVKGGKWADHLFDSVTGDWVGFAPTANERAWPEFAPFAKEEV